MNERPTYQARLFSTRADDWSEHTFGELIDAGLLLVSDGYRAKNEELGGDGLIFLRAGHVSDSHIDLTDAERFYVELESRVRSKVSRPSDVMVTTKGNSTGRAAYVTPDLPPFVYSPHLSFWRSLVPDRLVPGFLRAWSRGPEFQAQLRAMSHGTDMAPYLSLVDQRRLRITLPPPPVQSIIAQSLGALDDKIELNRRMNRTLEEMARALFRSWFVDFDPVRAKAAGRQPAGMDAETAALFPGEFEESEVGEIPLGWRVRPIGELIMAVGGATPSTAEPSYWDGCIPFATPRDMSSLTGPILLHTERRITEAGCARIQSGVLPKGTVLLSSRAPIGYLAITGVEVAVNQGIIAMVPNGRVPNYFALCWAYENMATIVANAGGTTFPEISKRNFRPLPAVEPAPGILARFVEFAGPLYNGIEANERQTTTLAKLRDGLLPRLLSGELRIQAAEEVLAVAG